MSALEWLAVAFAGFGAGILTSSVGVASLLSFPILVAVGLPPVVANTTNTIGLVPAGLGGAIGFREELRVHPSITRVVVILTGLAGAVGAVVLLVLPASVFEAVIPWLILGTCLLVGVQPRLSRWLAGSRADESDPPEPRHTMSSLTKVFVVLTGVYGGYFGAGAGVMMIATLALGLDIDLRVISALRTTSVLAANVVAGMIFAVVAEVQWSVVGVLATASIGGGYLGARIARIARRLPARVLRTLVVLAGIAAAVTLSR